jgi:hypothetical protein
MNNMKTETDTANAPKLDYCPFCFEPGNDYSGEWKGPIGRYCTNKSAPKYRKFWVECSDCLANTSATDTLERASELWNRRSYKTKLEFERNKIISIAKGILDDLEYKESEKLQEAPLLGWR